MKLSMDFDRKNQPEIVKYEDCDSRYLDDMSQNR